jgi:hypothetical protein
VAKHTDEPKTADLRRKVVLNILASPATFLPFVGGATALFGSLALDVRPDLGVLGFVAGVLCAGGMFLTKLFLGGEDYAREVLKEASEEALTARQQELDDLETRLTYDRDSRTENALKDLRSLSKALDELEGEGYIDGQSATVSEIRLGAVELFEKCIQSLEQSLKLWHTAGKMKTRSASGPMLLQRERVLKEVFESIKHFGTLLVALQGMGSVRDDASALARIRDELKQNLVVARKVDARIQAFETQLDSEQSE